MNLGFLHFNLVGHFGVKSLVNLCSFMVVFETSFPDIGKTRDPYHQFDDDCRELFDWGQD